jgi:hypothetical protein
METLTILIILGCNYILSFLLFTCYRTVRLLTCDKELRGTLLPRWYNALLIVKVLLYTATAVYLISEDQLIYLLAYTMVSLLLNGLGPVPYSRFENLVVRSACKRRYTHTKLDIFLTLIGDSDK